MNRKEVKKMYMDSVYPDTVGILDNDKSYSHHGLGSYTIFDLKILYQGDIYDKQREAYEKAARIYYKKGIEKGMDLALSLPQLSDGDVELGLLTQELLELLGISFNYHERMHGIHTYDSLKLNENFESHLIAIPEFDPATGSITNKINIVSYNNYRKWILKKMIDHLKGINKSDI